MFSLFCFLRSGLGHRARDNVLRSNLGRNVFFAGFGRLRTNVMPMQQYFQLMKYFAAYCVEQKMGDPHTPTDAAIATHIARPSRSKMTERPPHPTYLARPPQRRHATSHVMSERIHTNSSLLKTRKLFLFCCNPACGSVESPSYKIAVFSLTAM